jgi:hypothetical protein
MRFQFAARFSAKRVGIALVLLLGIASHAAAATITATYTGTVKTGFDQTGVFRTPATNLAGSNYSLVFSSDSNPVTYSWSPRSAASV